MIAEKRISLSSIFEWSKFHILWHTLWAICAVAFYKFSGWEWLAMPWLPLSIVGTAVAL